MRQGILFGTIFLLLIASVSAMPLQAQNQVQVALNPVPQDVSPHDFNVTFSGQSFGLENAIVHVQDNVTVEHLQDVLSMIDVHDAMVLSRLQNMTAYQNRLNQTTFTGAANAKFLGVFNMPRQFSFAVAQNGTLVQEHTFFDFLWSQNVTG